MNAVEGEISLSNQFSAYSTTRTRDRDSSSVLVEDDFEILCCLPTKLHRHISSQLNVSQDDLDSSTDEEDDPDYKPISDDSSEEHEEDSIALNLSNISLSSNISVCSTGESCISSILRKLQQHKWNTHNIDSFIQEFLCDHQVGKLFMYEMDVINVAIKEFYQKEIFSKKDNKKTRIDKIIT